MAEERHPAHSRATVDSDASSALRCTDVSHVFERGGRGTWLPWRDATATSVTALQNVTLSIDHGDVVGIAGPSGSGKSTLLHLLGGLLPPTEGTVTLLDHSLDSLSPAERTRLRHQHVGFVFQRFHLLDALTARSNVALPLVETAFSRRERRERAEELLSHVGLGDRVTHYPSELSGGERQRVAIARALATDPTVLLADEPTGELDSAAGQTVLEVLTERVTDRAVIIASHDERALAMADRVVYLSDGRIESERENHRTRENPLESTDGS